MSGHNEMRELVGTRKRSVTLTFNLQDQHEREVYEWCSEHGDNPSFIKNVLVQYKAYREFVQTVTKLNEMLPMMQKMFPAVSTSHLATNPFQQITSQLQQAYVPPATQTQSHVSATTHSHVSATNTHTPAPKPEPMPSRSARHGGSKRRRASMPME